MKKEKRKLSAEQCEEILSILKARFENQLERQGGYAITIRNANTVKKLAELCK